MNALLLFIDRPKIMPLPLLYGIEIHLILELSRVRKQNKREIRYVYLVVSMIFISKNYFSFYSFSLDIYQERNGNIFQINQLKQIEGSFSHRPTVTGEHLYPLYCILFLCSINLFTIFNKSTFMLIFSFQSLSAITLLLIHTFC